MVHMIKGFLEDKLWACLTEKAQVSNFVKLFIALKTFQCLGSSVLGNLAFYLI